MDIPRAFEYIFKDPQWVSKLLITGVITLLATVTTPFLIGLAGWAALLGYQISLIGNMRAGIMHPLPRWDDVSEYFTTGGQALIGGIVYLLPLVVIGGCFASIGFILGGDNGLFVNAIALCCMLPLVIAYSFFLIPMYGLALGRFSENPSLGVFFQFSSLLNALRNNRPIVISYVISSLIVAMIFGVINAIPCLGWLVGAALLIPVNGGLAGQYIIQMMGGRAKRKTA